MALHDTTPFIATKELESAYMENKKFLSKKNPKATLITIEKMRAASMPARKRAIMAPTAMGIRYINIEEGSHAILSEMAPAIKKYPRQTIRIRSINNVSTKTSF